MPGRGHAGKGKQRVRRENDHLARQNTGSGVVVEGEAGEGSETRWKEWGGRVSGGESEVVWRGQG